MRRGNWKISTKRYKRDSFFQPTLAGGNFPERGRSWPPILFDPMMLQLYTLCFFFLWSIGDIFSFFETTKIKPRTERTTKIIQKKRKSGAIGKPEKQASRALRLPASSYDDIPKPAAALGFRSPASSPSSSSSSPSSSRSWSCCGYYYALFTEWATFRFSLAFFLAQASPIRTIGSPSTKASPKTHTNVHSDSKPGPFSHSRAPSPFPIEKPSQQGSPSPHLFRSLLNVFPTTKNTQRKSQVFRIYKIYHSVY